MRLEQLEYIVEVANQKSISKAAKNLYISQPSLSKAISQLEAELKLPIFARLQQGIIPTADGERIIAKAQHILEELAELKSLSSPENNQPGQCTLRVSLPILLCNDLLNQTLHILHGCYPALILLPYQSDNYTIIKDLSDGSLDLGIISYGSQEKELVENQLKEHHIFFQILSRENFYFVTSVHSPLAACTEIAYEDLSSVSLATFSEMLKYNHHFALDETTYLTSTDLYLPSKESLLKTLLDDNQVGTIFPRIGALTETAVKAGELAAIPIVGFPNVQFITLLFSADRAIPPYAQEFVQVFLGQYNASLQ